MLASLNSADDQVVDLQYQHKRVAGEISKLERRQDNLFAELTEGDNKYRSVVRKRTQDNLVEIEGLQKKQQEINQDIESTQSSRFNIDEISDLFQNVGKVIGLMYKEAQ